MEFHIKTTHDSQPVDHDPVCLRLRADPKGCRIDIKAPFFGSPASPSTPPGEACPQLWDFEVVEAFFLNNQEQYLEVEFCPHGQHLVLLLNGRRSIVQEELPLTFESKISGKTWCGCALIPTDYLPPSVTRFNAFAIHGEGESRVYEALYPATQKHATPDFHRLEYFQGIKLNSVSPSLISEKPSDIWRFYSTL